MQEDFDTQTSQPTSHYYHRKVSAHLPLGISRLSPKCICKPSTNFMYFVNSAPISCILEAKPNCGTRQSWKSNSNAIVAMSNSTELVTHRWWKADLPHSLSAVLLAKRGCRKSDSGHQSHYRGPGPLRDSRDTACAKIGVQLGTALACPSPFPKAKSEPPKVRAGNFFSCNGLKAESLMLRSV